MGRQDESEENSRSPVDADPSGEGRTDADRRGAGPAATRPPSWLLGLRVTVLVVGVLVVFGVPALYQIGRYRHPALWHWQLYSRHHENVCETSWTYETKRGQRKTVDRAALLGATSYAALPRGQRAVNATSLATMNRRVCDGIAQKYPDVDRKSVRLESRCAAFKEWVEIDDGTHAVCERTDNAHLRDAPKKMKEANRKVWKRERRLGGRR